MTIGEKIRLFAIKKYGTLSVLAKKIGISTQTFSKYVTNQNKPGAILLNKLLKAGCDINWLLDENETEYKELNNSNGLEIKGYKNIPLLEVSAAAGINGIINDIETPYNQFKVIVPEELLKEKGEYYCIKVKGHSMEPILPDGTYVVIKELSPYFVKDNQIYVIVTTTGETHIKRVVRDTNKIICKSVNSDKKLFPDFEIEADKIHKIYKIALVVTNQLYDCYEVDKIKQIEQEILEMKQEIFKLKG